MTTQENRNLRKALFRGTPVAEDDTFGWRTRDEWMRACQQWAARKVDRARRGRATQ